MISKSKTFYLEKTIRYDWYVPCCDPTFSIDNNLKNSQQAQTAIIIARNYVIYVAGHPSESAII